MSANGFNADAQPSTINGGSGRGAVIAESGLDRPELADNCPSQATRISQRARSAPVVRPKRASQATELGCGLGAPLKAREQRSQGRGFVEDCRTTPAVP